jgi:site-specific recombinase XerD
LQRNKLQTYAHLPVPLPWTKVGPFALALTTKDEMEALLAVPDRQTPQGRAEHALLLFLYNTGARVSEATRLEVGNLQVGRRSR